ncbi:MAG: hypothetical protein AB7I27_03545 [Bacteriovoracaceae bacterium]
MKRLLPAIIFSIAAANAAPVPVNSPVDHLFVPMGFDNNDNVELLVSGTFPNPCYSRNKVEVQVKEDVIDVTVTALLNKKDKECSPMEVPYMENITIGNLQAGDYTVHVNNKIQEKLAITEASSNSVDDHLYAMMDYIDLGFTGGASGDAFLIGKTTDCLAFDKVEYVSNGKDTLSVLPIMKKISPTCSGEKKFLSIPIKFNPQDFAFNKLVLFVRTMDGKSINTLVEK